MLRSVFSFAVVILGRSMSRSDKKSLWTAWLALHSDCFSLSRIIDVILSP